MAAPGPLIPDQEIRREVERVIASPQFARSDLLTGFLRFIVEAALRGDAELLKEWVIGAEVYGRGQDFDPRMDSIVRTEARRLRRKLREYYESDGKHDDVVIELPTGSYEPVCRFVNDTTAEQVADQELNGSSVENEGTSDTQPPLGHEELAGTVVEESPHSITAGPRFGGRIVVVLATGAIALIAASLYLVVGQLSGTRVDRVTLLPLQCSPGDRDGQELGSALVRDLSVRLQQSGVLHVVEPGAASQLNWQRIAVPELGKRLKVDHVFTGAIQKAGSSWYLSVHIVRVADQVPVWTGRFDCSWTTVVGDESEILSDVLTYVSANSNRRQVRESLGGLEVKSLQQKKLCRPAEYVIASLDFLPQKTAVDYAGQELTRALTIDPDCDDARVLLAKLRFEQIWASPDRKALLEQSRSLLETVIKRDPRRADANALLAGVYGELGQRGHAMDLARHALQLGPLDSEAHRQIGWLYMQAGFLESAVIEDSRASALDPTDVNPLVSRILCMVGMARHKEANEALNDLRRWRPGPVTDLVAADLEMRSKNFSDAARLISVGRERTSAENRGVFDIADGLRSALTGNRAEGKRVFEEFKDSPPGFFEHLIILGAQASDSALAIERIRQNPTYFNYRFLVSEPLLAPLRGTPEYWMLVQEAYATWRRDLSQYGPSLPVLPAYLPSPAELLKQR